MVNIEITKMSSKGQIVIPKGMREDIKEGDKLIVIKAGRQMILQREKDFNEKLKDDLEFARRTEEAIKRIESGKGIKMDFDEFIEDMRKW